MGWLERLEESKPAHGCMVPLLVPLFLAALTWWRRASRS